MFNRAILNTVELVVDFVISFLRGILSDFHLQLQTRRRNSAQSRREERKERIMKKRKRDGDQLANKLQSTLHAALTRAFG